MPKQNVKQIAFYAGTKIPLGLKRSIEKAVEDGNYLNESDFVRNAIKEKLEKERLLQSDQRLETSHVQSVAFNTNNGSETNLGDG
ncbi:MAG: ribbon-helix-helix domain-containing protein [Nitrososphaeraceae archaeon]